MKCCFSVPLQALLPRPWAGRWRSRLPPRRASSPQHGRPPLPPVCLHWRGDRGAYLSAATVAICNADAQEPPHAPGQAPGSPPFFAFGWGERVLNVGAGEVSAKPRPAHRAALLRPSGPEGGTRLFLPRPSREGCPTPTAAPRSRAGERAGCPCPPPLPECPPKPLPSNQPTFNMTMAVAVPSSQGQAGEDIKHPPTSA